MEVKVPQLPESVADATLVAWHRKVGEAVKRDENLVDLETDKVVLEVPSPANGVLKEIRMADGSTVTSGEVLAVIEPGDAPVEATGDAAVEAKGEGEAGDGESDEGESEAVESQPPDRKAEARQREGREPGEAHAAAERPEHEAGSAGNGAAAPKMGPAVRKLIDEHDIDPARIEGTGRDGRLTKTDVLDYLATHRGSSVGLDDEPGPSDEDSGAQAAPARREQRVQMTRLRQRIAERLVEAQQTAAMLTTFNEADMSEIIGLRKKYQEDFQARYEIKLGFMSFFVRAVIEALRAYPLVNASVDGSDIVYHEYFDIGVAVSTERGLLVPVLRDAQNMSMAEIETGIRDFGERARSGEIGMDDLTGGTFTITNGGIFGSMMSTPILNPPQSAILGMHAIKDRPVVVDGEIAVRPMMYLALSYDHRIVDGREAVQFLVRIKEDLEDPARLLLQI
ncbi:MAG TPA: 2-oxoglutarate dehydrogenase complex dihydrolipoyllysine-residue succinyltransferase [Gammaproteobacteria bacterium]|nr:2-oxoglutarate dehydrogenase complex dihydrolipoyllysine-residue succinyltransferase [Gammaproteobacteria bacterium]